MELMNGRRIKLILIHTDTTAAMAALMVATATQGEVTGQIPLAALAAVTVVAQAALGKVEMRHIMVRVLAVADIIYLPPAAAAAIKA